LESHRDSALLLPLICSNSHHALYLFSFFSSLHRPPRSTLFPYTTLSRSLPWARRSGTPRADLLPPAPALPCSRPACHPGAARWRDRKSTRLNSSHLGISYAVFCLKKKNNLLNKIINVNKYHAPTSTTVTT